MNASLHGLYIAIADHAARLNKAILAMPQSLNKHVNNCCLNVLDILDPFSNIQKDFPDLSGPDLEDLNSGVLFVQDSQSETLEVFEKNVITDHDGEELFEIIPSSNPDSSCSLLASLDTKEFIVNHADTSSFEKFDPLTLCTDNIQAFDEPVHVNDFRLAILALPSLPVLLSRLKLLDLEDPLLTTDGTRWKDDDFQCIVDRHNDCNTGVLNVEELHTFQELFNTLAMEINNDMSAEPLLPYNVPSIEYETTAAAINHSDYKATLPQADYGIVEEQDFLTEDIEIVISQLTSGLCNIDTVCSIDDENVGDVYNRSTTSQTALEYFVKSADCYPQLVQSCHGSQKCLSPLVEHKDVEMVNDRVTGLLCKSLLEAQLETLAAEEMLWSECSLLDEDLKSAERYIWEEEKHFDEIHFSEPMFKGESLPHPIEEASVCLGLQLEDVEAENGSLKWSLDMPEGGNSLYEIELLSDDVCVHQLDDCEVFDKFLTSELDYMLTCSSKQSKSMALNLCMQGTAAECVDPDTADFNHEDSGCQSLDPLDSFIYVRARSVKSCSADVQSSSQNCDKQIYTNKNQTVNIQPSVAASPSNKQCTNIKTVEADFSGVWENVMQCIIDSAGVYLENMKREALIPRQQELMDISIDMTRFLLKEREKQMFDVVSQDNAHNSYTQRESILQSLAIVHILRTAADLLLHACLESCITYLAANSEGKPPAIAKPCGDLHQQLFHYQCQFLQGHTTHPKLNVLTNEVAKCSIELPGSKILILIEKGLKSLASAVESVLCQIPQLTVIAGTDWKCLNTRQSKTTVSIASKVEARSETIQLFTLVILYDERHNDQIKSWCQDKGISYTGLLTRYSCSTDLSDKPYTANKMAQITLVCSMEVTQYTQLVYLLETGYNILVIEREYHKLCGPDTKIHFADLIVSSTHCIVLLSIQDVKKHWDLTTAITRFLALGLQFSHCYIILHGMEAGTSYVMGKETLSNIYKLTAALCNLKGASSAFDASYKVFISLTAEDVAASIRDIVDHFLTLSSETDLLRPWLSADASQKETMLLQLNCMNSFSAQKLLHRLPISEILEKSDGELIALFPEIPEKTFKYLYYTTLSLKCQQSCQSTSSQNSCFSEVGSSNSHAMRTQKATSLSYDVNDDVQLTSTTSSDFGSVKSAYQQSVQTKMSVHSVGTNVVARHSPAQAKLKTRYTNPDNLIRGRNYSVAAAEPSGARQHHRVVESVTCASADLCCQPLAGSAEWDDPVECEEQMFKSDYVNLVSGVPQDCHNYVSVCENGNIARAQSTAGLQSVCCGQQQVQHAQKGTGSNRPTLTQPESNQTYNNPYNLGLSEQGNYQAKTLQENTRFTNGYYVTQEHQNQSDLQNLSPSASFVLRKKSCDNDGIQGFQRTIARAMQTFDINSCDKDPSSKSSSSMPQRRHECEPHSNCKPHMIDESDREACFELIEGGLSPILRQTDIASSVGNAYGEYSIQDEPVFDFQVSDKTGAEESSSSSRMPLLFAPVKKEIEDMIYDNSRLNLSEESTKHSAAIATQKPTYSLRNGSSFHKYQIGDSDNKEYVQNQQSHHFKTSFLKDEDNLFRLSDYLSASHQDFVPDPHGHPAGPGFGLFSMKAQRHRDIFSTSDENCIQSLNNTTEECSRNGYNLIYNKQRSNFKISWDGLLSTGDTTDGTMYPDLLPFSVSKELRKHIKKHNTQDSHNPARFLAQGNQNSVRVSRQPDYGNSQTHLNSGSLATSVRSQMRNPVIQQEVLNCTRESGTSLLQNVGQMRNPIKQQEVLNYATEPGTSLLQHVGQVQNRIKQPEVLNCTREPDTSLLQTVGQVGNTIIQDFQSCKREPGISLLQNVNQMRNVITHDNQIYAKVPDTSLLQNTNQTWTRNPLTSHCVQPTSRYSLHTTEPTRLIPCHQTHFTFASGKNQQVNNCQKLPSSFYVESNRTHSPSDFARDVTVPGLFQHCPPTNSNGIQTINPIRQADMPYTPRHRVTVGLAQPFRRQNASVASLDQPCGSGVSHRRDESPPMDLVPDDVANNSRNDDQIIGSNKYISEVKRNKWNHHLLSHKSTHEDLNKSGASNCTTNPGAGSSSVPWPSSTRKRKLQLERRAGNKGQTVLVFK